MTCLIVDFNSIASVSFYTDNKFNFFNMVLNALKKTGTNSVLFVADSPTGRYFRHDIYPDYKGNRTHDTERSEYIALLKKALIETGYPIIQVDNLEADDIIGSLPEGNWVFTKDRDLWQLYPEFMILTQDYKVLTQDMCYDAFGVESKQIVEYKALAGDAGDNIPGVKGIGKKWAVKLLSQYGSIGKILNNVGDLPGGIAKKIKSSNPAFWLSLVKIKKVNLPEQTPVVVQDRFLSAGKSFARILKDQNN